MSFSATHLIGFGAGGSDSSLSYAFQGSANDNVDRTTYTFASQPFGAEDPSRIIIVAVGGSSLTARTVSSATIGGVAATVRVQTTTSSGGGHVHILTASVPTGTTGTVSITLSGGSARCAIGIYAVYNLASAVPFDTGIDQAATSGEVTTPIDVPAGGFAIGIANTVDSLSWTWTAGLTEDFDVNQESQAGVSSGSASFASSQTNMTVSADDGTGTRCCFAVASWGN